MDFQIEDLFERQLKNRGISTAFPIFCSFFSLYSTLQNFVSERHIPYTWLTLTQSLKSSKFPTQELFFDIFENQPISEVDYQKYSQIFNKLQSKTLGTVLKFYMIRTV